MEYIICMGRIYHKFVHNTNIYWEICTNIFCNMFHLCEISMIIFTIFCISDDPTTLSLRSSKTFGFKEQCKSLISFRNTQYYIAHSKAVTSGIYLVNSSTGYVIFMSWTLPS